MATVLLLLLFACHSTVANAAVALGATRVIYPANQKQVLLPVTNNDPASVYLIQSWIENAGDQKDTQFVITPPLFSMQGKKENTLRIINATNHQLPGDRESLFYSVQVGNTHGGNTSSGTSGYSSLNYRGAYGNTNVGYSRSGDSSQIYYGMSGGIIAHADGITFGQPLGDTMVLVKAPGADNVKIENQTGIHTDWRGYAILPFATEYRENRVALNANSLADNVELDETVVTVIPTHGAIARATFNAQIGGKVLMTLKYGNKSVPFGAIVTHGENKNGSIVAENGQVYLTGLPQSGKLQVSWGKDKNSNCIVEYKLPEVSPGTLLNQQTAICR
ncbi:fimbrial biogenesis outer membrane usher protein [Escherichia coli]|nr:fimbrial biogenesis outer membrane usher protein [Escherichia coli]